MIIMSLTGIIISLFLAFILLRAKKLSLPRKILTLLTFFLIVTLHFTFQVFLFGAAFAAGENPSNFPWSGKILSFLSYLFTLPVALPLLYLFQNYDALLNQTYLVFFGINSVVVSFMILLILKRVGNLKEKNQ